MLRGTLSPRTLDTNSLPERKTGAFLLSQKHRVCIHLASRAQKGGREEQGLGGPQGQQGRVWL